MALVPDASVTAKRSDEVQFFDPGGNFERVLCPHCRADVTKNWTLAMDGAWSNRFSNLTFETPCCRKASDLNNLIYEWPAGFARFVLEVSGLNVGRFLTDVKVERVAQSLGCRVRQILAHY